MFSIPHKRARRNLGATKAMAKVVSALGEVYARRETQARGAGRRNLSTARLSLHRPCPLAGTAFATEHSVLYTFGQWRKARCSSRKLSGN
jgi:hypothetical protein